MTALIHPDQHVRRPDGTIPAAQDIPFRVWLNAWAPRHRAAFAGWIGAAATSIAAFLFLAFAALLSASPPESDPPALHSFHTFSVDVPANAQVTRALVYQGSTSGQVVRGDLADSLVADTPVSLENVAALAVTVFAAHATCAIRVDDVVVDQAEADGSVTCMWTLPRQR